MKIGFGVDLGGTAIKLACLRQDGIVLSDWEIPTDKSNQGDNILPQIAGGINAYIQKNHLDKKELLGVGIGVPGPVNAKGVVQGCDNLGWGFFSVAKELSALTGMKVVAGNDANMAALGESWLGGGKDCKNMLLATLGTGVGGGIVSGGRIIVGAHGAGGEIGHTTLRRENGILCGCGKRGCAEQYCSATGLARLGAEALADYKGETTLPENPTAKDIFDCAKEGDALALSVVDTYCDYLGEFLAIVCSVADPEVIVLGGGVSKAGDMLLQKAKEAFLRYCFRCNATTEFHLAALGNRAGYFGAFKLLLDSL